MLIGKLSARGFQIRSPIVRFASRFVFTAHRKSVPRKFSAPQNGQIRNYIFSLNEFSAIYGLRWGIAQEHPRKAYVQPRHGGALVVGHMILFTLIT